ncbi:thioredoxin reductase (NADPH) [Paenibacillus uliginis N3/975]|uniref:Ferredoxin--NADP reductase n=1 Tax=Paenibacillus uliginis N3/975 TaxID=1313296 RepID=A0A1X7HKC0_9BACL|nr:NAD(P)/FAD-dependent oxidoreductase [Paenibacillus uliginis]SMF87809.1 thioredoxin reductase (NADPH) [Paenibacillus uliginis N3/975]
MTENLELYDVTILGGGPAGMYTAFYSGIRELKTKVIDAQYQLGGTLLYYLDKMVWDVGGIPPITGKQLTEHLIQQVNTFEPTIVLGQEIDDLERRDDGTFVLTSTAGDRHWTRTIIMAIGFGGLRKSVKIEIDGAERYENTNLYYSVHNLEDFRGKRVLISGGGDSAVDWANELEPIAASVTLVHRRDQFKGLERSVSNMKASSVSIRTPYRVEGFHSEDGVSIQQVNICHAESGESEQLHVDAVIVCHGVTYEYGRIREWGLGIGKWNLDVTDKMETAIPGIFAVGDFVHYGSKVMLIAGAFNDAVLALNSAKLYIEPNAEKMARISSENTRFNELNRQLGVVDDDE